LWVGEFGANKYEMIGSTISMFDEMPEISGWAYWTWKKAATKYPGLATISLPADWVPIAKWISFPLGKKPAFEQASRGLADLGAATRLENTSWDAQMQKILIKTPAKPF
jgi:hypothetical protein